MRGARRWWKRALPTALLLASGCQLPTRQAKLPPLDAEGEVYLYLEPAPSDAALLRFTVTSVSATRADGTAAPLAVMPDVQVSSARAQRLLAWGRLAPGQFTGLLIAAGKATSTRSGEAADLLVPAEPTPVQAPFTVVQQRGTVLSLSFRPERSVDRGFAFVPSLSASVPTAPLPQLLAVASNTGMDNLTVFDKHARRVVAMLPTGRDPTGLSIDERLGRAYVALSGDDRIEVLDLLSGTRLESIRLRPGDRPRELALTPSGRVLVVASPGSNAVSFVDVGSGSEIGRAPTGLDPVSIVLDRAGRRAYVTNRGSSSITVLDVATRGVVATVATDAEPVRARLDRAERRLYVAHARSPYLSSLSLPDLAPARRIFVGGGVGALEVDPRTDLVYVGRLDDDRLQVFDPLSLMPIRYVDLPGPASYAIIDEVESALFVLVPGRRAVVTADLVSGRITSILEVGREPYQLAIAGARR